MNSKFTWIALPIALFFCTVVSAQITLNETMLVNPGDTAPIAVDTATTGINGGVIGGPQVWDFSGLNTHETFELLFFDPVSTPFSSDFPGSNIAMQEEDSSWVYLLKSSSELNTLGAAEIDGTDTNVFSFNQTIVTFPSTSNTSFSSGFGVGFVFTDSLPSALPYDSVGITKGQAQVSNIDAWGVLKTPLGDWDVLRQTIFDIESDTLWVFSAGAWIMAPISIAQLLGQDVIEADTTYRFRWWSNNTKASFMIGEYDYDPSDPLLSPEDDYLEWLNVVPDISISTPELASSQTINAFPNPAQTFVSLAHPQVSNGKIQLFDVSGKLVLQQSSTGNKTFLSVSALPAGIYHTVLINESGERIATQKLSVTH